MYELILRIAEVVVQGEALHFACFACHEPTRSYLSTELCYIFLLLKAFWIILSILELYCKKIFFTMEYYRKTDFLRKFQILRDSTYYCHPAHSPKIMTESAFVHFLKIVLLSKLTHRNANAASTSNTNICSHARLQNKKLWGLDAIIVEWNPAWNALWISPSTLHKKWAITYDWVCKTSWYRIGVSC